MKANKLFILIFAAVFFISCEKDKNEETYNSFSTITQTDEFGTIMDEKDTTDWRTDDTWNINEELLFLRKYSLNQPQVSNTNSLQMISPAYPNPFKFFTKFSIGLKDYFFYDIRIVNTKNEIVLSKDSCTNELAINKDSLNTNRDEFYRVYYKLYYNSQIFKGHGDIELIKDK